MLIDVHTHIFSPSMKKDRSELIGHDPGFAALYTQRKAAMAEARDVVGVLEKCSLDKAVVCGFSWSGLANCRKGNDYVLEASRTYPDRLVPFITLPWDGSDAVLEECERCLAAGAQGVGELALYCEPLSRAALDRLAPVAGLLAERKIPLLLHVSEPVGHEYSGKTAVDFGALQQFIASHQNLTIILAHWGGGFFFFELMPEVRKLCQRVYYDTAASPLLYHSRIYETAVGIVGAERILFGSDYPLLSPERYFKEIAGCDFPLQVRDCIRGENARLLLAP